MDASIQIKPGATDGADTLLLKGDRLSTDDMKAALQNLEEVTQGSAIEVAFEQARELTSGQGAGTRQWVLAARVTKLPITGVNETRYLTFSLGDRRVTLAYTLTSAFSGQFSWAVKPSHTDVSFESGKGVEISIGVGPVPATGVALLSAQLAEQTRKTTLTPPGLKLCPITGTCEDKPLTLAANSVNRLMLQSASPVPVGVYTGSITIAASEKISGEAFNLTVRSTSRIHQLGGLIVIAIGVLGSFLLSVVLPNRNNRLEALLPAAALRKAVANVRSKLKDIFQETPKPDAALPPKTTASLDKLDLTEEELDAKGYLPAVLPNPFGTRAARLDEFKTFLQNADTRLARLRVIVHEGFVPVLAQLATASDTQKAAVRKAIKDIDELAADETVSVAALQAEVKKIVAALQASFGESDDAGTARASAELTYERITATLVTTSALAWTAISLLSIVSGYYVLVYSELGFGLGGDYLKCLLWGFGLPTAAQQVLTLTPATVRTSLVSSVPRNAVAQG